MVTLEKSPEVIPNAARHELTHLDASQEREPIQMNFGEVFEIRDLRNHCAGTVMKLAFILAGTVCVRPTKRKDFYEVEGATEVYYIHVSPVNGIIYLLAVWPACLSGSRIAPLDPGCRSLEESQLAI